MQKYSYVALTADGKTIKGTMIAQSDDEIKQLVTKGGNYCLSYTKLKDDSKGQKSLPLKLVVNFCRQLGSILKAGLPLSSALEMLYGKTDKGPLKTAIGNVYEIVQKGNSLSDALTRQGKAFPSMMLNMVKAGEMSGDLDASLNKLADHFEKDIKLRNQVSSAMRYPKILGVITFAVVILLVTTVLPQMVGSMDEDSLPGTTKFLLGIADFVKGQWPILIIVGIVLYVGIPMILNVPSVRYKMDYFKLKAPKVGKMMRMIYTARFARSLATLYDGGIQLIEAMNMATAIVGNQYVAKYMEEAIYRVKKGETMSKALGSTEIFDPLLTAMLFVGEESGVLSEVLSKVADYFDEESSNATKGLTALLEPVMMILMAGIIGFILLSVITPMFSSYQNIG